MSDHERYRLHRRFKFRLVPRAVETIPPDFYQWMGKVRAVAVALLLLSNFIGLINIDRLGYDPDLYRKLLVALTFIGTVDIALACIMWLRPPAPRTMWRLTAACVVLEMTSILIAVWAFGSVGSHMMLFGVLAVLIYRISCDFWIGALGVAVLFVGHWLIVASELAGWIHYQPLYLDSAGIALVAHRHLSAAMMISFMIIVTFLVANGVVARLRHKEMAVRILRQTLAASGEGRVGHHTGSTLRDTYDVGVMLGIGGMGEVYRGTHRRTHRDVAIKILHTHLVDDEMLLRRFRREAEITGTLGSPNIVEVIDVDRDGDIPFLVLELLEGEDLSTRLDSRGALSLEETANVIDQAAAGLAVASDAGIVHRDLKPANLFLTEHEGALRVKVLDFGVSKIRGNATALTQEIALIGTPDYMSPEQATALVEQVDTSTDIFALGGIAYTCLTGERPFKGGNVPALLRRICDEEPRPISELRPEVPHAVVSVVALAMAKSPAERYQSVAEMRADLAAAFAGTLSASVEKRARQVRRGRPATRGTAPAVEMAHDETLGAELAETAAGHDFMPS